MGRESWTGGRRKMEARFFLLPRVWTGRQICGHANYKGSRSSYDCQERRCGGGAPQGPNPSEFVLLPPKTQRGRQLQPETAGSSLGCVLCCLRYKPRWHQSEMQCSIQSTLLWEFWNKSKSHYIAKVAASLHMLEVPPFKIKSWVSFYFIFFFLLPRSAHLLSLSLLSFFPSHTFLSFLLHPGCPLNVKSQEHGNIKH